MADKSKIINDPVYGFINLRKGLIFNLIEHPYFQRLRRIKQLGFTNLVFPGATHTRFQHAIGAMHLTALAVDVIRNKGCDITDAEAEAVQVAILLHDIGHGPFSHALENCIVANIPHEKLSLAFMNDLNKQFDNKLRLAIDIFQNRYHKKFLHRLICGQLDMDRLDYLSRDSFFTGVVEGTVGAERIIKMLQVVDDNLVVEDKGVYSIEKFIVARRLMYWQVYFHKTVVVAERLLIEILRRIHFLYRHCGTRTGNDHIDFFLENDSVTNIDDIILHFSQLDDADIIEILKRSSSSNDKILATLSYNLLNRNLPKIRLGKEKFTLAYIGDIKTRTQKAYKLRPDEVDYFVYCGEISNQAYIKSDDKINVISMNKLVDITDVSAILNMSVLDNDETKYYIIAPKDILNRRDL